MEKGTIVPGKPVSLPSPPDMLVQTTSCGGANPCDLLQMLLSVRLQGRFAFPVPPTLLPTVLLAPSGHCAHLCPGAFAWSLLCTQGALQLSSFQALPMTS